MMQTLKVVVITSSGERKVIDKITFLNGKPRFATNRNDDTVTMNLELVIDVDELICGVEVEEDED